MGTDNIAALPAEEALWLGAAYDHIKRFNHVQRMLRIRRETDMAFRMARARAS
jgi:hypothetical protein